MKPYSLTEKALEIINHRGKSVLDAASKKICEGQEGKGTISNALNYYATEILPNVLPIFPALVYLSCKAGGGNPEKTKPLATAMMLMTAAGDIHDDIIDNSIEKFEIKTIFGKYGRDIALLAGDTLLLQGTVALQNCESLTNEQKKVVTAFVLKSMTEIIKAESVEVELWKKADVTPEEYFEVIRLKGVIAGLHCRIGGVFAGADEKMLEDLTNYGRLIGILSTLKEEFVDLVTPSELAHRIKNELPPYPMLYALQNTKIKEQFRPFVKENRISSKNLKFIAETTLNSTEVQKLKAELRKLGENELASNLLLKNSNRTKELTILLEALSAEM